MKKRTVETSKNIFRKSTAFMWSLFVLLFAAGYLSGAVGTSSTFFLHKDMGKMRTEFVSMKNTIIDTLIPEQQYRCCLEKPCTYCIEKTPGHGEGASCDCLSDVVNGKHPCGECIGEILEGHGNKYLAKYFAEALADEIGAEHKEELKKIISEKYDISLEEQM